MSRTPANGSVSTTWRDGQTDRTRAGSSVPSLLWLLSRLFRPSRHVLDWPQPTACMATHALWSTLRAKYSFIISVENAFLRSAHNTHHAAAPRTHNYVTLAADEQLHTERANYYAHKPSASRLKREHLQKRTASSSLSSLYWQTITLRFRHDTHHHTVRTINKAKMPPLLLQGHSCSQAAGRMQPAGAMARRACLNITDELSV